MEGQRELESMNLDTGYQHAAIESYGVFKKLKREGIIEQDVKFQVSLPTMANIVGVLVDPAFRQVAEPVYEKALLQALKEIQDAIPHKELAIQIDLGMDLAYWEGKVFKPWFSNKTYIVEYIARMVSKINENVDLGIHYCYGDMEHKHFFEPESLGPIVDLHIKIAERCDHKIAWMHCPVPLSAADRLDSFYTPLRSLSAPLLQNQTKLFLGLVHPHDLNGTLERVKAAQRFIKDFGVSTECGWGRLPAEEAEETMDSIMSILRDTTAGLKNENRKD